MIPIDNAIRPFSPTARLRSIVHAERGIRVLLGSQHNAWIHAVATASVIGFGVALHVSRLDWILLVFALVSVWSAEAINTAIELLCDVASPGYHPLVKQAKDVAAGAVLICAVGAAVVGLLVLGPPLASLLF
jgi:diacylglycerol kinase (ATP)